MAFGWSDPYIPTETCEITINDFQSSHDLILLTPNSFNSISLFLLIFSGLHSIVYSYSVLNFKFLYIILKNQVNKS